MQALMVPLTAFPGHFKANLVCCPIRLPYVPQAGSGRTWRNHVLPLGWQKVLVLPRTLPSVM